MTYLLTFVRLMLIHKQIFDHKGHVYMKDSNFDCRDHGKNNGFAYNL